MKDHGDISDGASNSGSGGVGDGSASGSVSSPQLSEQQPVSVESGGLPGLVNTAPLDSTSPSQLQSDGNKPEKMDEEEVSSAASQNESSRESEESVPKLDVIPRKPIIIDNSYVSKDDPL